ncbi:Pre-mRNA-splicing factor cwf23 [Neolecta irregularis DAH-3]|uniref:Pre-mRNA-splicing factor cwf23 n=1 Tax=Neolecta irregularis (strain DAH-3) TaxID=1198029 RepID=A0A1U7LTZ2_NEOID|nr:Pre-mRNA-splicing factor cwf23 [Neolecta irregularis DAH-3]|eukprot:OLL26012.1 Pre-mRNA-splicing factor cwf23 [Neolecta irregularis DAH-3]
MTLDGKEDYYKLLNLDLNAVQKDLDRAFRKTALRYHPDKTKDPTAIERFHLLQVAYDVLSDPAARATYDQTRRAAEAKRKREEMYDFERSKMKEDLENREGAAKRQKGDYDEAQRNFQVHLERLRTEGAQLRRKREEVLRAERGSRDAKEEEKNLNISSLFTEDDRTLKVRLKKGTDGEKVNIKELFEKFGSTESVVVKGRTALIVYKDIAAAHAAFLNKRTDSSFGLIRDISWLNGREPDLSFHNTAPATENDGLANGSQKEPTAVKFSFSPGVLKTAGSSGFSSFPGPYNGIETPSSLSNLDYESITMMRLRQAEKKRLEQEIRTREESEIA